MLDHLDVMGKVRECHFVVKRSHIRHRSLDSTVNYSLRFYAERHAALYTSVRGSGKVKFSFENGII